jgi:hypothetical protein
VRVIFRGQGGASEYLHRYIMGCVPGDNVIVDHINGDILDNRRSNLRAVTQRENMHNVSNKYASNTSGHRGVSFNKSKGKYQAYIKIDYVKKHLGYFETLEEAVAARASASLE